MCFSATASFTSAALLVTTGGITTLKNKSKPRRILAAMPLLFGVQQAAEGILWLSLTDQIPTYHQNYSAFIFLSFALALWPVWVPWAIYRIEKNKIRKRFIKILGSIGILGALMAISILLNTEIKPYITGHSIAYSFIDFKRYWPANLEFIIYVFPTVFPFFVSSSKILRFTGGLIAASMVLTYYINQEASASVWCFFAAAISFIITVYVIGFKKGKITHRID